MTLDKSGNIAEHPRAHLAATTPDFDVATHLKFESVTNPLPGGTLGDIGLAARVTGPTEFPLTILLQPFDHRSLAGVDPSSIRVFRWNEQGGSLQLLWNSGVNLGLGFVWAKIRRPGVYVPIGLPRDRVVLEILRTIAQQRQETDVDSAEVRKAIKEQAIAPFLKAPPAELEELRRQLAMIEVQSSLGDVAEHEIRRGKGAHILSFPLPRDAGLKDFQDRLTKLVIPPGGLPEEALLLRADTGEDPELRQSAAIPDVAPHLPLPLPLPWPWPWPWPPFPICWLFSKDWWMYHHDAQHSGHASGCSSIRSTNVGQMKLRRTVPLAGAGPVITIPSIVHGKIYVGSSDNPCNGGTLFKIDIVTGHVDGTFSVPMRSPAYSQGIGGSPAVVGGRVYFSAIPGWVYCVDANTMGLVWVTDLRKRDLAHNQPVDNIAWTDCWSSPLVVNGKVYVGCGEGEGGAFGFVYCLDANNGHVKWLFCTNQFTPGQNNNPNVIPASTAAGLTDPQLQMMGFKKHADPPERGVSVWSSCAYDSVLNRVYVGTGNSASGDFNPLPDKLYGSGVLSLDADTGALKGFFQPSASDSYRPTDTDVDVCSSPLIFTRGSTQVVAIGSKNGSLFLLDAANIDPATGYLKVLARRQLLPYKNNNPANPIPAVDPDAAGHPGENMYGVFGTAALHAGMGKVFVGVGGYGGAIDTTTTPFMRALDWNTLADAWTTVVGVDGVTRYTVPRPPMYTTAGEVGLSSPAVVNDVVFVSTAKPALYALDVATGLCLWLAPGLSGMPPGTYILGPAIYSNYAVIGAGNSVYIYSL
jgi:outer membrane protein assembly factor BamB